MKPARRASHAWASVGMLVLASWATAAMAVDTAPVAADSTLELIRYKAPTGWRCADRPGQPVRLYISPDSDAAHQATIVVLMSPAWPNLNFRGAFNAMMRQMTGGGKLVEGGTVAESVTRQGFASLSQSIVTENAAGQRAWVQMIAANVQNRLAAFCYLSNSSDLLKRHQPDMDALLRSVRFDASPPVTNGIPCGQDDQLLAAAKKRFANELEGRRRPHVVLGDILGLDGKPIPSVVGMLVTVGGTTVAAERTSYNIDVDGDGRFAQQIPDGVYTVHAYCLVRFNDRHVPVDLVAIDGKRDDVVQSSDRGIVRDFRLAMQGLKSDADPKDRDACFGGVMSVCDTGYTVKTGSFSTRHPGAKVRVTFTPQGPLIDGSVRPPFALEVEAGAVNYGARLQGLPIGLYRVAAVIVNQDGTLQTLLCNFGSNQGEFTDAVDLCWETYPNRSRERTEPIIYVKD